MASHVVVFYSLVFCCCCWSAVKYPVNAGCQLALAGRGRWLIPHDTTILIKHTGILYILYWIFTWHSLYWSCNSSAALIYYPHLTETLNLESVTLWAQNITILVHHRHSSVTQYVNVLVCISMYEVWIFDFPDQGSIIPRMMCHSIMHVHYLLTDHIVTFFHIDLNFNLSYFKIYLYALWKACEDVEIYGSASLTWWWSFEMIGWLCEEISFLGLKHHHPFNKSI